MQDPDPRPVRRTGRRLRLLAVAAALASTAAAQDEPQLRADLDAVLERVDELETMLFQTDERVGSAPLVQVFDALGLQLGGFLTQQWTLADGDASSESAFNATQLEILIAADIDEDWSFFTALGFLREADLDFADRANPTFRGQAVRIPPIISWVNYRSSDALEVTLGRFVTPHGIINIEHFPPVLLELNQPMFLRPFPGSSIFPNFLAGVDVHGRQFVGESGADIFEYHVYAATHSAGDPEDLYFGARASYAHRSSGLTFGANLASGERTAGAGGLGHLSITPVASTTTNDFTMFGADLLYDAGPVVWKNEVFASSEDGQEDRSAFYTQPAYELNDEWLAFYRYDHFDPGQGIGDSTEHVLGVNYLPTPTTRFRAELIHKEFDSPDAEVDVFQLSATISF